MEISELIESLRRAHRLQSKDAAYTLFDGDEYKSKKVQQRANLFAIAADKLEEMSKQ